MKWRYSLEDTLRPSYRYPLKGAIHSAGFRRMKDFADAIGFDESQLSRVITGWYFPSGRMQRAMARALGLTLVELKELLLTEKRH